MVNGYSDFGWTALYGVIQQWEQFGVFTVLFPFILIFAIVFAILEKIKLFDNRGVNLIIALILGFFTVSNPYVGGFFMYFFSNLAIGIAIMLALIILLGVALKPGDKSWMWIFSLAGGAIFLVVMARSGVFKMIFGEGFWFWLQRNSAVVIIFAIVALMVAIVFLGPLTNKIKGGKVFRETTD